MKPLTLRQAIRQILPIMERELRECRADNLGYRTHEEKLQCAVIQRRRDTLQMTIQRLEQEARAIDMAQPARKQR